VVENGALREVTVAYDPVRGDTLLPDGRRLSEVHPETAVTLYALTTPWYRQEAPITVQGRRYTRYGLPRVLSVGEVRRYGDHLGVAVFVAAAHPGTARPDVVYVPLRRGCEFQAYRAELMARAASPAAAEAA